MHVRVCSYLIGHEEQSALRAEGQDLDHGLAGQALARGVARVDDDQRARLHARGQAGLIRALQLGALTARTSRAKKNSNNK